MKLNYFLDMMYQYKFLLDFFLVTYQEVFSRLPLPYFEEDFKFDDFVNWKDTAENKLEPPPYVQIKRSILSLLDFIFSWHLSSWFSKHFLQFILTVELFSLYFATICSCSYLTKADIYLVKKKKDNVVADIGCTNCSSSECGVDCVCRYCFLDS